MEHPAEQPIRHAGADAGHHAAIARYYDYTHPFYRVFWHGSTGGLHYGLADASTRTPDDELLNTNRFLANVAAVDAGCHVLDAGCGVGGSALWMASHLGARVTGLTLSPRQARRATLSATSRGVADLVSFRVEDYLRSSFDDASFDVVWAIESACYSVDKGLFIREAWRLLRPGGRLVVADGFLLREPVGAEIADYHTFLRGLVLPNLAFGAAFADAMQGAGFEGVKRWDKTREATPSSRRLHRRCSAGYPLSRLGEAVGVLPALLTENIRAGIVQLSLVERGIASYEVLCGRKPSDDDAGQA